MEANNDKPKEFVFHGTIVQQEKDVTLVRLFPGLNLEVQTKDIDELEEATDDLTQRTYVRVKLKQDANIKTNFQPRLARLASAAEGVPFAYGGAVEGAGHALPSGSPLPVWPPVDPRGIAAFQGRLSGETLRDLASDFPGAFRHGRDPVLETTSTDRWILEPTYTLVGGGQRPVHWAKTDEEERLIWNADYKRDAY